MTGVPPPRSLPDRPPPPRPVRRGLAIAIVLAALALGAAGCGRDAGPTEPPGPVFGGRVAVVAGTRGVAALVVIDATGAETEVPLPARFATALAAGPSAAGEGAPARVVAVRLDGSLVSLGSGAITDWAPVPLDDPAVPPSGRPTALAVSPDGRLAILIVHPETTGPATLRIADPDTGGVLDVPIGLAEGSPPAWLDADRVVVLTRTAADRTELVVLDTRTVETRALAIDSEGVAAGNGTIVLVADDRRSATEWSAGPEGLPAGDGAPDAVIAAPGADRYVERVALDRSGGQLATSWTDGEGRPALLTVHVRTDAGWVAVATRTLPADGPVPLVTWLP
jgi:hypothetical protein